MRVLVLDDDEIRHKVFAAKFKGVQVTHAYNVEDAVNALNRDEVFDLVHLDHDLEDFHYIPYKVEMTGMDVARFISRMDKDKQPKRVVVHSWNTAAAPRMVNVLRDAGIPAVWELFQKP